LIELLNVILLAVTLVLVILVVTGYDQYFALRAKVKAGSRLTSTDITVPGSSDPQANTIKIKKVKASKVGSYLVITLVLSEQGAGDKVSIDDPTLLLPLVQVSAAEEREENLV